MDSTRGQLDAGLYFVCSLNEYILHKGSAVSACPPGAREGGYVGETLLENA